MYRTGFWFVFSDNLKSLPGLTKGKQYFPNMDQRQKVWKQKQQILGVDIPSRSELPVTAKPRGQHRRTHTPAPRASHRNCIVVFLPYVFHPLNVHSTHQSPTETPKPQEQNRNPIWQMNVIFQGKKLCVYTHRQMRLTIHYTWHIRELRNVSDVPSQQCPFQHLQTQPNECDVRKD